MECEDLARIAPSGGAAIMSDVVEVLEDTCDLEALGWPEVLAADLGASHFVPVRERMLDREESEGYRASLARVIARLQGVEAGLRAAALTELMEDLDPHVRAAASMRPGALGRNSFAATPPI